RSENRGYAVTSATPMSTITYDASMGPRSENRGYVQGAPSLSRPLNKLQWVHGPRTVVMSVRRRQPALRAGFNGSTVREPWLWDYPNYDDRRNTIASMGPRSENRGYGLECSCCNTLSATAIRAATSA